MVKYFILTVLVLLASCSKVPTSSSREPTGLLVENLVEPLNVHNHNPRLSWHGNVESQSHYQVQVASSKDKLSNDSPDLWDSGKVQSKRSTNVLYQGKTLNSRDKAFWRVRVWSDSNIPKQLMGWSQPSYWEMGLLDPSDWEAKWLQVETLDVAPFNEPIKQWMIFAADIASTVNNENRAKTQSRVFEQLENQPTASLFRHQFSLVNANELVNARLHSTAAGYYEIFINGKKVDERIMDPGQTDYDKRILYNSDDVSDFLVQGDNAIAVHLGSGWYNEDIAFSKPGHSLAYGQPAFIAQLELTFNDGTKQLVVSNDQWLSHPSPVLKEGVFSGELFDANRAVENWNKNLTANQLNGWKKVKALASWPTQRLEPQMLPPIRAVKKVTPIEILNPEEGVWVFDFGQNFTGIPTLNLENINLSNGQAVYLRYAEWADKQGNISQKSGGAAPLLKQVDAFVASDDEQVAWTPAFTWHGFRYVEVRGLKSKPPLDTLSAHLVRSDVERVGKFVSSDPLLNRIHEMALWSYEGNLMALPMDCPIRERAGWTGDAHAALITGNYNFNMQNFWGKYLDDFETSKFVAPAIVPGKRTHGGSFDWAVAEVMIAWETYRHYGDTQQLQKQYASLLEYMQAAENAMSDSLLRIGYGDWCDPVLQPGMDRVGGRCNPQHTSPTITSSALLANAANLMAKISLIINESERSEYFSNLYARISHTFHQEFYDPNTGHYGSQTADAMALRFGITPPHLRQSVADALNKDVVEKWGGHASVGALGQTYLYLALSDYGYGDTAFNIFKAQGYPGYSYLLDTLNATTLWERKGGFDPTADPTGTSAPGRSLNHPFHSGYDGWFYEGLGGIRPLEDNPGFQTFELRPVFPKGLSSVDVSFTSAYGKISSRWKRKGEQVSWHIEIPNNSSAFVTLPGKKASLYTAGQYSFSFKD